MHRAIPAAMRCTVASALQSSSLSSRPAPRPVARAPRRLPVLASDRRPPGPTRREVLSAAGGSVVAAAAGGAGARRAMAAAAPGEGGPVAMDIAGGAAPAASAIPRAQLAPGLTISRVVKGCWQLSGGHGGERDSDRTSGQAAVEDFQAFVQAGITTFDTADIYGPSESLIGRYLASHPAEKPGVQVLTKFCCFGDSMNQAKELRFVEQSIDGSRQRLGVESLDLVQFYWHNYGNQNYVQAAQHLAALQKKGKIKHVGATNFDVPRLQEFVDAGVTVANNQVQYSLLDRRAENGMAEFCAKNGVTLLPYGVLAGGFLTDKYLGASPNQVKVNTYSKSKYSSVIAQAGGWDWLQSLLGELSEVGKKHGVTIADVACRWVLDRPQVAGILVGARNASHVGDAQKIFSFALDAADQERIAKVLAAGAQSTSDCYSWERGGKW